MVQKGNQLMLRVMCNGDAIAEDTLTSHLGDFDPLQLLLGRCERGRTRAGRHVMLEALQADVLLELQAKQEFEERVATTAV